MEVRGDEPTDNGGETKPLKHKINTHTIYQAEQMVTSAQFYFSLGDRLAHKAKKIKKNFG